MKAKVAVLFNIILIIATCIGTTVRAQSSDTCSIIRNTLHETRKYDTDDTVNSIHAMWAFEAAMPSLPRHLGKTIINSVVQKNGGRQYDEISPQDRAKSYSEAFEEILKTSCKENKQDPTEKLLAPTGLRVI